MKFRPAFAVLSMTLAIAACGELPFNKEAEPEAPGHTGPPGVSPIDQPIETGTETKAVSTAEATTMNTAIFRAVAADGAWTVHAADKTAVYARPGQRSLGVTTRRITYAGGVEFIGVMNNRPFTLNVSATECRTASGERFPMSARLSANGARSTGCAGPATEMPKADAKAPGATPRARAATPPKPAETKAPAATTQTAPDAPVTPSTSTPASSTEKPAAVTPSTPTPSTAAPVSTTTLPTPSTETKPVSSSPETKTETSPAPSSTTTPAPAAPSAPSTGSSAPKTPAPSTVTPPAVLPPANNDSSTN